MRAGKRKLESSRREVDLPARVSSIFVKPVLSTSPTIQRQARGRGDTTSDQISKFNFGNIPVLSANSPFIQAKHNASKQSGNGSVQTTCATCSKEYEAAESEKRSVNQESLCPKCGHGNAHSEQHSEQDNSFDRQAANVDNTATFSEGSGNQIESTFDSTNSTKPAAPSKALGESTESKEAKPRPEAGGATIQCNGSGGYEIVYNGWAGTACGTKACVTAHENSHIADWKSKWPSGCTGRAKGYLPKGDPPHDNPLLTVAEYNAFLEKSECKAHTVDLTCAKALPKLAACKTTVEDYIKLTEKQKKKWCPSLSTGAKVAIGAVGGAAVGAGIGALFGGIGAPIGAGVGAVVGGIAGALF